jgi:hypothetical protein
MNERMMAAADSSQHSPAAVATANPVNHAGTRQTAKNAKKANASERIGVNSKTRRR